MSQGVAVGLDPAGNEPGVIVVPTSPVVPATGREARRRRLLQDSACLASGQIAALAAAAVVGLVSARWLGPDGRGELVLALAVASLLGPLAAVGVDSFIASRSRLEPEALQASLAAVGLRVARWGGTALAAGTVAYGASLGLPVGVVVLGAAVALVRPTLAVLQAITTAHDRVASLGRVLAVSAVSQLIAVLALSLGGATVGDFVAASLVGLVVGCILLVRITGWPVAARRPVLDAACRRRVRRFGGKVVLGDALQTANYRLDVFVLAAFVPVSDVGVYAVAVTVVEILWQLPHALSRSLLPRISAGELHRAGVVRLSSVLAAGLVVVSAAGLALASWLTVPVLGGGYAAVPALLAILLPGVVAVGATKPLAAWTLSQGHPERNLRASGLGFAVVVVGDLLLIPRFGLAGAALASTLAYVVTAGAVLVPPRDEDRRPRPPGSRAGSPGDERRRGGG